MGLYDDAEEQTVKAYVGYLMQETAPHSRGIDITETGLLDGQVKERYQNKAYAGTNNPDRTTLPRMRLS